jgi:hypothetical protein
VIALLLTICYFGLIGAGVLTLIGAEVTPAKSFLFGMGVGGTLLFAAGAAHIALTPGRFLAVVLVASVGFFFRRPRPAAATRDRPSPLPLLLAAVAMALVFADAALLPLRDYDGRTFWTLKGKAIAHERSISGPFFFGLGARNLHNHYPLLVPLDEAAIISIHGGNAEDDVRWIFVLCGVALVLLVVEGVAAATSPAIGTWCAVVVAFLPQVISRPEGSAISAYADLPLAAFIAAAFFDMDELYRSGRAPVTLPFWIAFIVLTKNEGMIVGVILIVTALARWRSLKLVLPPAVAVVILLLWRYSVPDAYDENYAALVPLLPERLHRIGSAAGALLARMFEVTTWGLFWPAAIAGAVVSFRRVRALVLPMVCILAAYVLAYAVTSWNIAELASVSADRLLLHLAGPAAMTIGLGAWTYGPRFLVARGRTFPREQRGGPAAVEGNPGRSR